MNTPTSSDYDSDAAVHGYRPIFALPYWEVIGAFVEDAVRDALVLTERPPRDLFAALTPFVLWCWQARGMQLSRKRLFRRSIIDQFIHLGAGALVQGSRATHRATLWRIAEVLNPEDLSRERRTISRSAPTPPYTDAEVVALYSWARTQTTPRRRIDAIVLLALGLGGGLATRELLAVQTADVFDAGARMVVAVTDTRPRTVPVLADWEEPLRRACASTRTQSWLFRPGRTGCTSGQVTDFLTRARTTLDIRPARMRSTWLLHHLLVQTPPLELLRISGLRNLAALDKLAVFLPQPEYSGKFSKSFFC